MVSITHLIDDWKFRSPQLKRKKIKNENVPLEEQVKKKQVREYLHMFG